MTEVSDTLRKALALIEKPENWCRGLSASDANGRFVMPTSKDAVGWCLSGALRAVTSQGINVLRSQANQALADVLPEAYTGPIDFNDHPDTTHPMVVDALTRAIAEEEANG